MVRKFVLRVFDRVVTLDTLAALGRVVIVFNIKHLFFMSVRNIVKSKLDTEVYRR